MGGEREVERGRERSEGVGERGREKERRKSVVRGTLRPSVVHAQPIWPHTDAAGEKERRGFLPPSSSLRCGILPRSAELSSSMGTDWV
jgi:hypothetical protein